MRISRLPLLIVAGLLLGGCRVLFSAPEGPIDPGPLTEEPWDDDDDDDGTDDVIVPHPAAVVLPEDEYRGPPMATARPLDPEMVRTYADWDLDGDAYLSESEVERGLWHVWDVNRDGVVEPGEWRGEWLSSEYERFEEWDLDQDGTLTPLEYGATWRVANVYSAWDADRDELIAAREFGAVWESAPCP